MTGRTASTNRNGYDRQRREAGDDLSLKRCAATATAAAKARRDSSSTARAACTASAATTSAFERGGRHPGGNRNVTAGKDDSRRCSTAARYARRPDLPGLSELPRRPLLPSRSLLAGRATTEWPRRTDLPCLSLLAGRARNSGRSSDWARLSLLTRRTRHACPGGAELSGRSLLSRGALLAGGPSRPS